MVVALQDFVRPGTHFVTVICDEWAVSVYRQALPSGYVSYSIGLVVAAQLSSASNPCLRSRQLSHELELAGRND
jgi:hypothetical protein